MTQETSTGPERAASRAESTVEREAHKEAHGVSGSEGGHSREGNVNSGGQGPKGKVGDVVGAAQEIMKGSGLRVGAGAYQDGAVTPDPYFMYGTVDTGGYGGPPNIGAVSHVFAKGRRDALVLAGQIVDDTTNNAAAAQAGGAVGTGLAPELVTMTPLTGQAQRDLEKARVEASAAYQSAHPVMVHGLTEEQQAAAQPGDEFGNPVDEGQTGGSQTDSGDYDDHSSRGEQRETRQPERTGERGHEQTGERQSQAQENSGEQAQEQPQAQRKAVDPTRSGQTGQKAQPQG